MREFKIVECKSHKYDVVCVKESCPWWVHDYKGKWKDYWECSIVTQHTCHLPDAQKSHRNLTSQYIANEIYGMIVANLSFELKLLLGIFRRSKSIPFHTGRRGVQNRKC
jgi:hypothetical protein